MSTAVENDVNAWKLDVGDMCQEPLPIVPPKQVNGMP